ncbi:AEC family transporter [Evansella sp. AB-P1]|uniref:AEC family transporter n=1 Tax=Evansella sp. AB-P1 TaxID=3037653 RepID=UPI00241D2A1E|nr:AEC family transporter [Evansella sp. AB-P1]MDG5787202.1 AEC family transporter [Evansella sp. AB-P1]
MFTIVFVQVILPIVVVFLIGYVLQRKKRMNLSAISTVTMYVFIPALIFTTFYETTFDMQYVYMVVFYLILFSILIIINKLYCKIKKLPQSYESAYILNTAFMNVGNYGAPIILLAYGMPGFEYAISFFVLHSISMHTFGLYYAARGNFPLKIAVKKVFQVPMIYATIVVLLLNFANIPVPEQMYIIIDILASAAVPSVMLMLGMQLAFIKIKELEWGSISYSVIVRLVVSPIIAFFITLLFPFDPLLAKVLILVSAMPSAVVATMYATEFDAKPELVSSTVLVTTILSMVTITILLMTIG